MMGAAESTSVAATEVDAVARRARPYRPARCEPGLSRKSAVHPGAETQVTVHWAATAAHSRSQ
jgi:hypothetical protein